MLIPLMKFLLHNLASGYFLVRFLFFFLSPLFDGVWFRYSQIFVIFLFSSVLMVSWLVSFIPFPFLINTFISAIYISWLIFICDCVNLTSHRSLSDSKSPQVSRTLLRILADLNNAVVWMVSTRPLIFKSSSPCTNPLVTSNKNTHYHWYHCQFHVP